MIVITTPSGTNGRQILAQVMTSEEEIRVVSHDPSKLDSKVRERVEVIAGSLDDAAVVHKAFAGADTVFLIVPPNDQTDNVEKHYVKFAETASEAITNQGVRRVIWISTLGRDTSKEAGHYTAALAADKPLEATSADHRILRPAVYMDNLLWQVAPLKNKGVFFLSNAADQPHFTVATRDIAATAAALLLDPTWNGRASLPLIGDSISPNEMAQVISEVLDRPIRFQQLTDDKYKTNMMATGANSVWSQGLADMATAENNGFYDSEPDTSGRTATDFRLWCEEVLKPAVVA